MPRFPNGVVSSVPQVLAPVDATFTEKLELFLAADVIKARRATPGHAPGNKSDPESYSTFKTCKSFIDRVLAPLIR